MAKQNAGATPIDIKALSLEELQAHAEKQAAEIKNLTAAAAESTSKIEGLSTENAEISSKNDELTESLKNADAKLNELSANLVIAESKVAELTEEVAELTKINEELVAASEVSEGLKADVYLHGGVGYQAISPSFNYKGRILTAKEIKGDAGLIAELVEAKMLTPIEEAE